MKLLSYEEYIGKKINKLTINNLFKNEKKQLYANCTCECGNNKDIYFHNIRKGFTKSCGCGEKASRFGRKHSDDSIVGKKFGRLTIIEDSGERESNGSVLWKCQCDCGNITYSNSSNLKRGHTTSCGCAKQDFIESTKIDIIGRKFGFLTVLEEVFNDSYKRRMVKCKCDCGNETICAVTDLTTGHSMSCGCMCKSKGEMSIENLLKEFNIQYESQKRFKYCKNKKKLPFDFYLPTYNLCIEYQGEQHYKPVEYWGGIEKFKVYKQNDSIKKKYCEDNKIHLLCLPYTLTNDEIKSKIINILNP